MLYNKTHHIFCEREQYSDSLSILLALHLSPAVGSKCSHSKQFVYSCVIQLEHRFTVEPLIMDTLKKKGQCPYNRQTICPLSLYCPYISTSEEGTAS